MLVSGIQNVANEQHVPGYFADACRARDGAHTTADRQQVYTGKPASPRRKLTLIITSGSIARIRMFDVQNRFPRCALLGPAQHELRYRWRRGEAAPQRRAHIRDRVLAVRSKHLTGR